MRSLITLLSSVGVMFWFPHPCSSSCFLNSVAVFEVSIVKASQLLGRGTFQKFFLVAFVPWKKTSEMM